MPGCRSLVSVFRFPTYSEYLRAVDPVSRPIASALIYGGSGDPTGKSREEKIDSNEGNGGISTQYQSAGAMQEFFFGRKTSTRPRMASDPGE